MIKISILIADLDYTNLKKICETIKYFNNNIKEIFIIVNSK